MFVTNWISTTKIQKISEITNFFRHYFLSRTEVSWDFSNSTFGFQDKHMLLPIPLKERELNPNIQQNTGW